MNLTVAAFTDTYLPTVNGVTYTIKCWRDRWNRNGGRMEVVFPGADGHTPGPGEHPVSSVSFPFYEGYRVGAPSVPEAVRSAEVIHAHTAFSLGLGGLRLARRTDAPIVASYHTPASEYASYLSSSDLVTSALARLSGTYERWFFDRVDLVIAPTAATRRHLKESVGVSTPVEVISNGIDTERFRPVDATDFRRRHDLTEGPLVGYTGRHGYEKNLDQLLAAADGMDATVVFGGDGPARDDLEERAEAVAADVRFLGFLDRAELPAFYSALDVFAFPSPVETQGLVALEANACGTPVVGVDSGALSDTIEHGRTGYHFDPGDVEGFRERVRDALRERDRLRENCLDRRESYSIEGSVEKLADTYDRLL